MEVEPEVQDRMLQAAGAQLLPDGRKGLTIHGWEIETQHRPILNSRLLQEWEGKLQTPHLPEMVFGESSLVLKHLASGAKLYFNAFDALKDWKKEGLPPVEVPAAAKWKFRSNPSQQVILDYDYTFTTPYCGSETVDVGQEKIGSDEGKLSVVWKDCKEQIDMAKLAQKENILFFDEVILYEDELADNGISLLTVKVRVMPSSWFLLLRYWLRVDGVLMRLRETRVNCVFEDGTNPTILRESCWRESTFQALSDKGYPSEASAYSDPSTISQRLPAIKQKNEKLEFVDNK
ncbi:TIP41-like protein isoform X2 [Impatiens glandulifera]|uniref:TIP41-like protein isoform X2 n=1 Tax=Impatiens glandulifera TaxID=253017 RepID=UPI001FB1824F|nr:TIP41-like protein isoform X2 [Impatiens glandulifera]